LVKNTSPALAGPIDANAAGNAAGNIDDNIAMTGRLRLKARR